MKRVQFAEARYRNWSGLSFCNKKKRAERLKQSALKPIKLARNGHFSGIVRERNELNAKNCT